MSTTRITHSALANTSGRTLGESSLAAMSQSVSGDRFAVSFAELGDEELTAEVIRCHQEYLDCAKQLKIGRQISDRFRTASRRCIGRTQISHWPWRLGTIRSQQAQVVRLSGQTLQVGCGELARGGGTSDERAESVIESNTQAIEEIDEGHSSNQTEQAAKVKRLKITATSRPPNPRTLRLRSNCQDHRRWIFGSW